MAYIKQVLSSILDCADNQASLLQTSNLKNWDTMTDNGVKPAPLECYIWQSHAPRSLLSASLATLTAPLSSQPRHKTFKHFLTKNYSSAFDVFLFSTSAPYNNEWVFLSQGWKPPFLSPSWGDHVGIKCRFNVHGAVLISSFYFYRYSQYSQGQKWCKRTTTLPRPVMVQPSLHRRSRRDKNHSLANGESEENNSSINNFRLIPPQSKFPRRYKRFWITSRHGIQTGFRPDWKRDKQECRKHRFRLTEKKS